MKGRSQAQEGVPAERVPAAHLGSAGECESALRGQGPAGTEQECQLSEVLCGSQSLLGL